MSDSIARIWGKDFALAHEVRPDMVASDGNARTITVPSRHPLTKWLYDMTGEDRQFIPVLTVDSEDGRWSGIFKEFRVRRPREGEPRGEPDGEYCWLMESQWIAPDWPGFARLKLPA